MPDANVDEHPSESTIEKQGSEKSSRAQAELNAKWKAILDTEKRLKESSNGLDDQMGDKGIFFMDRREDVMSSLESQKQSLAYTC